MVRLWRANTTLTAIPLFPAGKAVAGNNVQYATIACDPGVKEYNSGVTYTQNYFVTFEVFSTNLLADAQAVADKIGSVFDFVGDSFGEVLGQVLTVIPMPETTAPDPAEQLGKVVHTVTARWAVKVCQRR